MDLFLITDENRSHFAYIKDFNRFMCNKTTIRIKNILLDTVYKALVAKILINHNKVCWKVKGKQNVKLRDESIIFKNYSKQLAVPFKIYACFESVLRRLWKDKSSNASYTKEYQAHIPSSFAHNVVCINNRFSNPVVFYRGKKSISSLKQFLMSMIIIN